MKGFILCVALLLPTVVLAQASDSTISSVDCNPRSSGVERAICGSRKLTAYNAQVANMLEASLSNGGPSADTSKIVQAKAKFLSQIGSCSVDGRDASENCMESAYLEFSYALEHTSGIELPTPTETPETITKRDALLNRRPIQFFTCQDQQASGVPSRRVVTACMSMTQEARGPIAAPPPTVDPTMAFAMYTVAKKCAENGLSFNGTQVRLMADYITEALARMNISQQQKDQAWQIVQQTVASNPIRSSDCASTYSQASYVFPPSVLQGGLGRSPF